MDLPATILLATLLFTSSIFMALVLFSVSWSIFIRYIDKKMPEVAAVFYQETSDLYTQELEARKLRLEELDKQINDRRETLSTLKQMIGGRINKERVSPI